MAVHVSVNGLDDLLVKFKQAPEVVQAEAEAAAVQSLVQLKPDLEDYPPELPNQKYIRTYALQSGWAEAEPVFTPMSSGFEAMLTNPTDYGPYVQDKDWQASIHQGRWQTTEDVVKRHASDMQANLDAAEQRITQKLGG